MKRLLYIGEKEGQSKKMVEKINATEEFLCEYMSPAFFEEIEFEQYAFVLLDLHALMIRWLKFLNEAGVYNIIILCDLSVVKYPENFFEKLKAYHIIDILFKPILVEQLLFKLQIEQHGKNTLYYQIVENMDSMALITDEHHRIIYANQSLLEETGFLLREIIGKKASIFKSGNQNLMFYDNLKHTLEAGMTWHGTFQNKRKDGSIYFEDATIFSIYLKHEKLYIKIATNVTKREEILSEREEDYLLASAVQQSLLPDEIKIPTISTNVYYKSFDSVSGDIYYWTKLSEDKVGIFLADVIGHGMSSALITTSIIAILTSLIAQQLSFIKILEELNQSVISLYHSKDLSKTNYFTFAALIIDTYTKEIEFVNCGHPPMYLIQEGRVKTLMKKNYPIGLFKEATFEIGKYTYQKDLQLLLYTDGLIEMGIDKLKGARLLENKITHYIKNYTDQNLVEYLQREFIEKRLVDIQDDITVIGVEIKRGD